MTDEINPEARERILAFVALLRDDMHIHSETMMFPGSDYRVKAVPYAHVLSVIEKMKREMLEGAR